MEPVPVPVLPGVLVVLPEVPAVEPGVVVVEPGVVVDVPFVGDVLYGGVVLPTPVVEELFGLVVLVDELAFGLVELVPVVLEEPVEAPGVVLLEPVVPLVLGVLEVEPLIPPVVPGVVDVEPIPLLEPDCGELLVEGVEPVPVVSVDPV